LSLSRVYTTQLIIWVSARLHGSNNTGGRYFNKGFTKGSHTNSKIAILTASS